MLETISSKSPAVSLPIDSIGELPEGDYVGLIDDNAVQCLTVRLAAEGLLSPIWVRRNGNAAKNRWTVIAGRHRLRAALALGWTAIEAEQRADERSTGDDLRRLQVAENLDRRVLRPIELACHHMERWSEAAALVAPSAPANQQSSAIRARWSVLATLANTSRADLAIIDQTAAEACSVSDRTMRRYRHLHTAIVTGLPDHFARLNAHPLGESLSAMMRLAGLNDIARPRAAEVVLSRPDWNSMDDVLASAGMAISKGNRCPPDVVSRFTDAWGRAPLNERRRAVAWLTENITPGMALDMVAGFKRRGLLP